MGDPNERCARHGCEHPGQRHLRRGTRLRWTLSACLVEGCACEEFLDEPLCKDVPPIVATAASGKRYSRCACGVVTEIPPQTADAR